MLCIQLATKVLFHCGFHTKKTLRWAALSLSWPLVPVFICGLQSPVLMKTWEHKHGARDRLYYLQKFSLQGSSQWLVWSTTPIPTVQQQDTEMVCGHCVCTAPREILWIPPGVTLRWGEVLLYDISCSACYYVMHMNSKMLNCSKCLVCKPIYYIGHGF